MFEDEMDEDQLAREAAMAAMMNDLGLDSDAGDTGLLDSLSSMPMSYRTKKNKKGGGKGGMMGGGGGGGLSSMMGGSAMSGAAAGALG